MGQLQAPRLRSAAFQGPEPPIRSWVTFRAVPAPHRAQAAKSSRTPSRPLPNLHLIDLLHCMLKPQGNSPRLPSHAPPPPCSAGGFPWESSRAIRKCVHERKCWEKGHTAVCGVDPHTHHTIGFPNRCCEC